MRGHISPLPALLRKALLELSVDLHAGKPKPAALQEVLSGLDGLPPETAITASIQIRQCWWDGIPPVRIGGGSSVDGLSSLADIMQFAQASHEARRRHLLLALRDEPDLAWFMMYHGDGRLREMALDRVANPPGTAFRFIAIALRLNDWVEQVRAAAAECAGRLFPGTSPAVVADAALVLLLRHRQWSRWRGEADILEAALRDQDVADELALRLAHGQVGPLARILGQALHHDGMDRHLPALARNAVQPAVRAKALTCLIEGRATWPEGYAQQWVNKPLGLSRRVAVTGGRDLRHDEPVAALLRFGAADRSPIVRKMAASALIRHRAIAATMPEVVGKLAADRNAIVRERIAYLLSRPLDQDTHDARHEG